jgi:hypothetical protein
MGVQPAVQVGRMPASCFCDASFPASDGSGSVGFRGTELRMVALEFNFIRPYRRVRQCLDMWWHFIAVSAFVEHVASPL